MAWKTKACVDHKRRERLSVTCCGRWRQRTPSCESSLEALTCWPWAARRSCAGWTGPPSDSRGRSSLWTSSAGPCSCAVGTNRWRSPPGAKHKNGSRQRWQTQTFQMFIGRIPACCPPGCSSQRPHSPLPHCCRSYRHRNQHRARLTAAMAEMGCVAVLNMTEKIRPEIWFEWYSKAALTRSVCGRPCAFGYLFKK